MKARRITPSAPGRDKRGDPSIKLWEMAGLQRQSTGDPATVCKEGSQVIHQSPPIKVSMAKKSWGFAIICGRFARGLC